MPRRTVESQRVRRKDVCAAVLGAMFCGSAARAEITSSWTSAVSGIWIDSTKWSGNVSPNGSDESVFVSAAGAPYSVMLNDNVIVGKLRIDSPDATVEQSSGQF